MSYRSKMKKFLLMDQIIATYAMVINVKMVAKIRIQASSAVCPANLMVRR